MSTRDRAAHQQFVKALQHESIACERSGCHAPVQATDLSTHQDRVKTFALQCQRCGWKSRLTGHEQLVPSWDDSALLTMANDHLMHQQPNCPFDDTPVVFTSLPNPRRAARYRLSCFYCGRQAEIDWPPGESRR